MNETADTLSDTSNPKAARFGAAPDGLALHPQFRRSAAVAFDSAQARNSDLKIIADQQGHGMRTHLDNYVQSGVVERKAKASKLYADFIGVLRKRG